MIIWINGPFGAGKTTLAGKLRELRPAFLTFDPEEIGFVVKTTVPVSGDYQDLPLWRGLTIAALAEIRRHYSQGILVPMTLVQPEYLDELLEGARRVDDRLLHVFLDLDADVLRERIERQTMHPDPIRDAEIRNWRLAQVGRCLSARDRLPARTQVLDCGSRSPEELAAVVLQAVDAHMDGGEKSPLTNSKARIGVQAAPAGLRREARWMTEKKR